MVLTGRARMSAAGEVNRELEQLATRYVHALSAIVAELEDDEPGSLIQALEIARDALAGHSPEYWTTTEVAAYLNVKTGTVSMYRKREQMPSPDLVIGRTPCWRPEKIRRWHAARPRAGSAVETFEPVDGE